MGGLENSYIGDLRKFRLEFSGRGSAKYAVRYQADMHGTACLYMPVLERDGTYNRYNGARAALTYSIGLLESRRDKLSEIAYAVLKADFVSEFDESIVQNLMWLNDEKFTKLVKKGTIPNDIDEDVESIDQRGLDISITMPELAVDVAKLHLRMADLHYSYNQVFDKLKVQWQGQFRDRLLLLYIQLLFAGGHHDTSDMIAAAMDIVATPYLKTKLLEMKRSMSNGSAAYNFRLQDAKGKWVSLRDFSGKLVFIDIWFTGCEFCRAYYKGTLAKVEKDFSGRTDIVFLTISVDTDKARWVKSLAEGNYTSDEAINLYTGGLGFQDPMILHY